MPADRNHQVLMDAVTDLEAELATLRAQLTAEREHLHALQAAVSGRSDGGDNQQYIDMAIAERERADRAEERESAPRPSDTEILDWMADERVFDGIGEYDIDEMTLAAGSPDITEDGWKLEWRRQMRIAVALLMKSEGFQSGKGPTRERVSSAERELGIARCEWKLAQSKLAEIERNLSRITGDETDYVTNIEALRRALAAAKGDVERMDWIERAEGDVSWSRKSWAVFDGQPEIQCILPNPAGKPYPTFATLRDAIDAAREKEKQ